MQLLTVKHNYTQLKSQCLRHFASVSFVFICNKKHRRCYDFVYQFFGAIFLRLFKTLAHDSTFNCHQIDFIFYIWRSLWYSQTIAGFSKQNTELFGEYIFRSCRTKLFYEKGVLKNFAKFGRHLCRSLLFNKAAAWKPQTIVYRNYPG